MSYCLKSCYVNLHKYLSTHQQDRKTKYIFPYYKYIIITTENFILIRDSPDERIIFYSIF